MSDQVSTAEIESQRTVYQDWAQYYDAMDVDRSHHLAFYSALARNDIGRVLDLGCGTGSITIPVAAAIRAKRKDEVEFVGIDISPEMVAIAAQRAPDMTWLQGDMRSPPVEGAFDLIMCCFHTLQALTTDDDLALCLQSVAGLLSETGRFAFDIYKPNLRYLESLTNGRIARSFVDDTGTPLEVVEDAAYDQGQRVLTGVWRLREAGAAQFLPKKPLIQQARQYFPDQLGQFLENAGLKVVEKYGDLDRSPASDASKRQVIVCRRSR